MMIVMKWISGWDDYYHYLSYINDQKVCLASSTNQWEDQGGPLVTSYDGDGVTAGQNYELIGIGSYSWSCGSKHPATYSRTTSVLDWIGNVTKESFNTCSRT